MNTASITTTAVNTWLQAVRLPLTTMERVLRLEPDSAAWGPALVFEDFEALVRDRAGAALRNPKLREQARLQRAELAHRRRADAKLAEAAEHRDEADAEFEQRRRAAEDEERRREQRELQRAAELERERREAEQRVERNAAEREAEVETAAERRERLIDASARRATTEKLETEEQALREKEKALRAREKALRLEDEVQKTKARRKNGAKGA